jgi:hypothetical protein
MPVAARVLILIFRMFLGTLVYVLLNVFCGQERQYLRFVLKMYE